MKDFVSVIIPVYNDPDGLRKTVESLLEQSCDPGAYEIIIADNGSNDDTLKTAMAFCHKSPETVKVVLEDRIRTSYGARNKGIEIARGTLIVFIDANVTTGSDYIQKVLARFQESDVDYLGCNVKMERIGDTLASVYNSLNGFNIRHSIQEEHYTPTCNLAVRREVIDAVGDFDSRLEGGGDFEFGERVYGAGFALGYAEDIVLHHPTRWRYSSLIRKAMRVGRGNAQMAYYYPQKYRYLYTRHFNPRKFLPRNPVLYYKRLSEEQIPVGVLSSIALSLYHIPLAVFIAVSCFREAMRLKREQHTLRKG